VNALALVREVLEGTCWVHADRLEGLSDRVRGKIREILDKRLPNHLVLQPDDSGEWYGLSARQTWWAGYEVNDVHVVNKHVDDVVEFVENFCRIPGEVCFSDADEQLLYHRRKTFLGIVMRGPARACWGEDVYSDIDPFTGRRFPHPCRTGQPRTEDWLIPAKSSLLKVVTNDRHFLRELDCAGIPAERWEPPDPHDPFEEAAADFLGTENF